VWNLSGSLLKRNKASLVLHQDATNLN